MTEPNPVPGMPDVGALPSGNAPAANRPGAWHIWLALAVAIAGPIVYTLCLGQPFIRTSGAPIWIGVGIGAGWALKLAKTHRRWWMWTVSGMICLAGIGLLVGFNMPLPTPKDFTTLAVAPDFTLPDEHGQPVSLKAELTRGPVHLVFYRGHW